MRVLVEVEHFDVIQLDIQVLVDALEAAADSDVVLELDDDRVVCEGFEETRPEETNELSALSSNSDTTG